MACGIIAAAAVGLSYTVLYLDKNGVDIVIVIGLKIIEYGLFLVDLILFARFLWQTCKNTWREL